MVLCAKIREKERKKYTIPRIVCTFVVKIV